MAESTAVPTITRIFKMGRVIRAYGTLAVGASTLTYATGGIALDFSSKVASRRPPLHVHVEGLSAFDYRYIPGTSNALGKLFVKDGAGAEHAAAAVDAAVSGDTIKFVADFDGLV
jgi:hypothetical protein